MLWQLSLLYFTGLSSQCYYHYSKIFRGHCYFGNVQKLNWYQALHSCRQQNGYLADIDSAQENTAVANVFSSSSNTHLALIGLNDINQERRWVWQLNGYSRIATYTNWARNQPDNSGNEDCAEILLRDGVYSGSYKGGWNDAPCSTYATASVCETGRSTY